jgi:hypothetical protein
MHQTPRNKRHCLCVNRNANVMIIASIIISLLYIIYSDVENVSGQQSVTTDQEFLNKFVGLTNESRSLTNAYQQEIGKWQDHQSSNTTILMNTNDTIAQINNLINKASNLQTPEKYREGASLYVKSLQAERDSYKQFGDFITTGNTVLNETSIDLFSESLIYEIEALKAIQSSQ